MAARMGKTMRRKKRTVPKTHYESAKMFHEGKIAAKQSRKKPLRNGGQIGKKNRERLLRLGKMSADKMVKGTIGMNLAKKRAKKKSKTTKKGKRK